MSQDSPTTVTPAPDKMFRVNSKHRLLSTGVVLQPGDLVSVPVEYAKRHSAVFTDPDAPPAPPAPSSPADNPPVVATNTRKPKQLVTSKPETPAPGKPEGPPSEQ